MIDYIKEKLGQELSEAKIEVVDLTGTNNHFAVEVVSPAFESKSLIQRHQMVYRVLNEKISTGEIHALSITAKTPKESENV